MGRNCKDTGGGAGVDDADLYVIVYSQARTVAVLNSPSLPFAGTAAGSALLSICPPHSPACLVARASASHRPSPVALLLQAILSRKLLAVHPWDVVRTSTAHARDILRSLQASETCAKGEVAAYASQCADDADARYGLKNRPLAGRINFCPKLVRRSRARRSSFLPEQATWRTITFLAD